MSSKKTLEQAYFHINNGGISFSIIEKRDVRKDRVHSGTGPELCDHPNENPNLCPCSPLCYCKGRTCPGIAGPQGTATVSKKYNRSWVFRVATSHFGSGVKFDFPLTPVMIGWTLTALRRVLVRMETPETDDKGVPLPTDGPEFAFRDQNNCHVKARDGEQVDEYWPIPREICEGGATEGLKS